jgi:anti-sigma B factor antagonist
MLLRLDIEDHQDHARVIATGEIDAGNAEQVESAVAGVLNGRQDRVLLDFAGVTFIDSSGLGALVKCHREAQAHGATFAVVQPSPHTRKLVRVLGLDQLLFLHDSYEEALDPRA